jgi:hypothetical protein
MLTVRVAMLEVAVFEAPFSVTVHVCFPGAAVLGLNFASVTDVASEIYEVNLTKRLIE